MLKILTETLERITDAFVALDKDWHYTYMNKKAGEIFNCDPKQMIGKHIWTEFPEGINQPFYHAYYKAMATQTYIYLEEYYEPYDLWFENHIYPSPEGLSIYFRDITEQKKTLENLRVNETSLKRAQQLAHIGSWELNFETGIAIWSDEACRIYGLKPHENNQTYESWLSFIHPDDLEFVLQKIKESKKLMGYTSMTHRIVCKDKTIKYIYTESNFEFDLNCKPTELYGITYDITKRTLAEEKLKESEALYRFMFERNLTGIFRSQLDGKILTCNIALANFLGYDSVEEILQIKAQQFYFSNDDRENFITELRSKGEVTNYELKMKRKDGSPIYIVENCSIHKNALTGEETIEGGLIDITERKKAEEKIKISELMYRSLIEQASDAIMITDLLGNFVDVNDSMCKMFGYSKEELIGTNAERLIDTEELKTRPFLLEQKKLEEQVFSERRMVHKNGTIIEIEANVKKINHHLLLAIARDITERKKAERKIAESENRLKTIFQTEPECIKLLDKNGKILEMNPAGLALIEADSLDEVVERKIHPIINEKYRHSFFKLLNEVFTGKSGVLEFEITGLKGTQRWMEMHAVPMKNQDGEIISLLGISRDITERKKATEAIMEEKNMSESIINSLPGVFYLADLNGNLLRWNKNFETISGYTATELSKLRIIDMVDTDEKQNLIQKKQLAIEKGNSDVELNFLSKIKKKTPYYFTAMVTQYNNQTCILGIGIDITERKTAEKEIVQMNDQLRSLSGHLEKIREEERTNMAREIHDELGQQLTGLKMDVSFMIKKMIGNAPDLLPKLNDMIKLIDETIGSVRRIAGSLRPGVLDDLGLIAALQWQTHEFEKRTGINCIFEDHTKMMLNDRDKNTGIFRIFQETLTNIARHSGATEVKIVVNENKDQLGLGVSDNGKGFNFEDNHSFRTLGLIGMRERALMMGGQLIIKSAKGEGTKIMLIVPLTNT